MDTRRFFVLGFGSRSGGRPGRRTPIPAGAPPFWNSKIVSATPPNTTLIRPLWVIIVKLGCPVIDAFQGRGFWSDVASNAFAGANRALKFKTPPLQDGGRMGHPHSKFNYKARAAHPEYQSPLKGLANRRCSYISLYDILRVRCGAPEATLAALDTAGTGLRRNPWQYLCRCWPR